MASIAKTNGENLFGKRLLCYWLWPLVVLASVIWDVVCFTGGIYTAWWDWLCGAAWYALALFWWHEDARGLRLLQDAEKTP